MKSLKDYGDMLRPSELAEFLGFQLATVYRWNSQGVGPQRIRIGNKIYYKKSDIAAWISDRESV